MGLADYTSNYKPLASINDLQSPLASMNLLPEAEVESPVQAIGLTKVTDQFPLHAIKEYDKLQQNVIDGDTIRGEQFGLRNDVRMQGYNAPEMPDKQYKDETYVDAAIAGTTTPEQALGWKSKQDLIENTFTMQKTAGLAAAKESKLALLTQGYDNGGKRLLGSIAGIQDNKVVDDLASRMLAEGDSNVWFDKEDKNRGVKEQAERQILSGALSRAQGSNDARDWAAYKNLLQRSGLSTGELAQYKDANLPFFKHVANATVGAGELISMGGNQAVEWLGKAPGNLYVASKTDFESVDPMGMVDTLPDGYKEQVATARKEIEPYVQKLEEITKAPTAKAIKEAFAPIREELNNAFNTTVFSELAPHEVPSVAKAIHDYEQGRTGAAAVGIVNSVLGGLVNEENAAMMVPWFGMPALVLGKAKEFKDSGASDEKALAYASMYAMLNKAGLNASLGQVKSLANKAVGGFFTNAGVELLTENMQSILELDAAGKLKTLADVEKALVDTTRETIPSAIFGGGMHVARETDALGATKEALGNLKDATAGGLDALKEKLNPTVAETPEEVAANVSTSLANLRAAVDEDHTKTFKQIRDMGIAAAATNDEALIAEYDEINQAYRTKTAEQAKQIVDSGKLDETTYNAEPEYYLDLISSGVDPQKLLDVIKNDGELNSKYGTEAVTQLVDVLANENTTREEAMNELTALSVGTMTNTEQDIANQGFYTGRNFYPSLIEYIRDSGGTDRRVVDFAKYQAGKLEALKTGLEKAVNEVDTFVDSILPHVDKATKIKALAYLTKRTLNTVNKPLTQAQIDAGVKPGSTLDAEVAEANMPSYIKALGEALQVPQNPGENIYAYGTRLQNSDQARELKLQLDTVKVAPVGYVNYYLGRNDDKFQFNVKELMSELYNKYNVGTDKMATSGASKLITQLTKEVGVLDKVVETGLESKTKFQALREAFAVYPTRETTPEQAPTTEPADVQATVEPIEPADGQEPPTPPVSPTTTNYTREQLLAMAKGAKTLSEKFAVVTALMDATEKVVKNKQLVEQPILSVAGVKAMNRLLPKFKQDVASLDIATEYTKLSVTVDKIIAELEGNKKSYYVRMPKKKRPSGGYEKKPYKKMSKEDIEELERKAREEEEANYKAFEAAVDPIIAAWQAENPTDIKDSKLGGDYKQFLLDAVTEYDRVLNIAEEYTNEYGEAISVIQQAKNAILGKADEAVARKDTGDVATEAKKTIVTIAKGVQAVRANLKNTKQLLGKALAEFQKDHKEEAEALAKSKANVDQLKAAARRNAERVEALRTTYQKAKAYEEELANTKLSPKTIKTVAERVAMIAKDMATAAKKIVQWFKANNSAQLRKELEAVEAEYAKVQAELEQAVAKDAKLKDEVYTPEIKALIAEKVATEGSIEQYVRVISGLKATVDVLKNRYNGTAYTSKRKTGMKVQLGDERMTGNGKLVNKIYERIVATKTGTRLSNEDMNAVPEEELKGGIAKVVEIASKIFATQGMSPDSNKDTTVSLATFLNDSPARAIIFDYTQEEVTNSKGKATTTMRETLNTNAVVAAYMAGLEQVVKLGAITMDDRTLEKMYGESAMYDLSTDEKSAIAEAGYPAKYVAYQMGMSIARYLGITIAPELTAKERESMTPKQIVKRESLEATRLDDYEKLIMGLGLHAIHMMNYKGYIEYVGMNMKEYQALFGNVIEDDAKAKMYLVKLGKPTNGKPKDMEAEEKYETWNKYLLLERDTEDVFFKPVTKVTENIRRNDITDPTEAHKEYVDDAQRQKWHVKEELMEELAMLSTTQLENLSGLSTVDNVNMPQSTIRQVEGQNRGIKKTVATMQNLINKILGGIEENAIWFKYFIAKNGRPMVDSDGFNAQGDKTHRHLTYTDQQKTTVDMGEGSKSKKIFMLGMAQNMGQDTDKMGLTKTLEVAEQLLGMQEEIEQKWVDLQEAAANGPVEASFKVTTAAGEEIKIKIQPVTAFLDGLLAMRKYNEAVENGAENFETTMTLEADGMTNGFALKLLQIMYNISSKDEVDLMREWMKKTGVVVDTTSTEGIAGMIQAGDIIDSYRTLAKEVNKEAIQRQIATLVLEIKDLQNKDRDGKASDYQKVQLARYEAELGVLTAGNAIDLNEELPNELDPVAIAEKLNSIYEKAEAVFGALTQEDGTVSKFARELMKTPFMTFMYGAGSKKMRAELAAALTGELMTMVSKMDDKSTDEEVVAKQKAVKALLSEILGIAEDQVIAAVRAAGKKSDGAIDIDSDVATETISLRDMEAKLKAAFSYTYGITAVGVLEEKFDTFKKVNASITGTMGIVFEVWKRAYDAAVAKYAAGEGENRYVTKDAFKKALDDTIHLFPIIKGPDSKSFKDGIAVFKRKLATALDTGLKDVPLSDGKIFIQTTKDGVQYSTSNKLPLLLHTFEEAASAAAVITIHSLDASVVMEAVKGRGVMQIFDAIMLGVGHAEEIVQYYNEVFFKKSMQWSLLNEVLNSVNRLVDVAADENADPEVRGYIEAAFADEKNMEAVVALEGFAQTSENAKADMMNKTVTASNMLLTKDSEYVHEAGNKQAAGTIADMFKGVKIPAGIKEALQKKYEVATWPEFVDYVETQCKG